MSNLQIMHGKFFMTPVITAIIVKLINLDFTFCIKIRDCNTTNLKTTQHTQ